MLLDKLLFSDTVPTAMRKSLDLLSTRQSLISSNIGNLDTPGFKASDIDFRGQLREALGSKGQLTLRTTNEKHFGPKSSNIGNMAADPFEEEDAAKSNGNNVNIDKEMAKLAENQIVYNAMIQLMLKRGSTIKAAITESAQ
jgi:flagellar basal-body rod protein FlgB